MIYFVIRILVNALALAITIILAPGIDLQPALPGVVELSATYILFGILFGIINAFIRPLVLLFTARMLVRTMGSFAIVINGFLFWLLAWIAPNTMVIEPPRILWLAIAGMIMAIVVTVMEALFGLDRPEFRSQTEDQFYWRWVALLSTGRRNAIAENLRVAQITDIIGRYTKDIAVDMSPLARFRTFMQELLFRGVDPIEELTLPAKVRYMLQELGPTFVKFGQIVGSRAETIPPEWQREMERLQSNVPPFSYHTAREIMMRELKDTPENLYGTFEKEPFAAASTAQVHRATLHDGTPVVVKIQRPNIDVTVKADLNVMHDLAKRIQKQQEWAQNIDLHGLLKEFAEGVLYELDYRNEAANMRLLGRNMEQFDAVHVPQVYPHLSGVKVLTMEYLDGVKINNVESIDAAGLDREELARHFVQALTKQILFDGFFHADPHPGNVLVILKTGQIGFLDMGLMGEMNRDQRMALADVMISMRDKDGYSLGKAALRLSKPMPGRTIHEKEFLENMDRFGQRFLSVEGTDTAYSLTEMQTVLRRNGLRLDPNLTLAIKNLIQAEEIVKRLDPNIILTTVAVESSMVLAQEQFNMDALSQTVRTQVTRSVREVVYRMPSIVEATTKWLDQYEKGRLSVHIDTSDLGTEISKLDKVMNKTLDRLIIGLILVGWLIGAAIAVTIDIEILGVRISNIAFYMFIAGALVGAYVVFITIRRMRREDEESNY